MDELNIARKIIASSIKNNRLLVEYPSWERLPEETRVAAVLELQKNYQIGTKKETEMVALKVTKISASYSCKKQIRQYEPIDVFMAAEAEISTDNMDEVRAAQKQLFEQTKQSVSEMIAGLNASNS